MKLLILLVCSLTLQIQSQSLKPTRKYNGYKENSEAIYFREQNESQENTQRQSQVVNDSYLQAQQNLFNQMKILNYPSNQNLNQNQYQNPYINQFSNQNQNVNYQYQQPSLEVLPPIQTSQDYYNARQNFLQNPPQDYLDGINRSSEVKVVPLTTRNATQDDMRKVSLTTSFIGINMIKRATDPRSNVVVSPFSVINMLALLQSGAAGETQRQITDALRINPEISAAAFHFINTDFKNRGAQGNILKTASGIFAADAFNLEPAFENFAKQNFDSEVSKTNFGNSNEAAQKINAWIAKKTNNQIDKLVSPDSVGTNTQLVLANAVYFKGIWETIFKPESTSNQEFRLSNGQKKSLPFMSLRSSFRCGLDTTINALVAVIPFQDKQYSLVMLLPQPNSSVQAMLQSLNGEKLADYQNIRPRDTLLEIPKFTVRTNTDLGPIFNMMGITKMFTPASELTNIGQYRSTSPQVSSAVHSAMMSIDERGATAAASTVVAAVALSYDLPSLIFRADRPFLAVLWDTQLNVPLFMTKIEDPSS